MDKAQENSRSPAQTKKHRWAVLLAVVLFIAVSAASIIFYTKQLEGVFLDNVEFYMSEIADHDIESVDSFIERQWEKLYTIGNKLALEEYKSVAEARDFLGLETAAGGFEYLALVDKDGFAYDPGGSTVDLSGSGWELNLVKNRRPFVAFDCPASAGHTPNDCLLYGVPINAVAVDGKEFVGVVGSFGVDTVKDSLRMEFFNGEGQARVVSKDGYILTGGLGDGAPPPNLIDELKGCKVKSGDSVDEIIKKLSALEPFSTVCSKDGQTAILSAKPLANSDWMLVVEAPETVVTEQADTFISHTAMLLTVLALIIGTLLMFAFILYRRTLVLKNSKEVFYREKLFNLLALHTDDVFIIQDVKSGKVNFISGNAERTLGRVPLAGDFFDPSIIPNERRKLIAADLKRLLENSDNEYGHVDFEFEWTMPADGRKKWIHASIYSVVADFMERPEPCLIIVLADFTRVRNDQQKLEAAKEQAQEAARSKSMFLSNMSHEMRTPLNGIIGCLNLMKNNINDSVTVREYLQKAETTANYLISLVGDILDMSKIESHKLGLENMETSLKEIARNMETMFRSQMEEKGIFFSVETEPDLWTVSGDGVRISQVLTNLLSNAIKFTKPGGCIRLSIGQEPHGDYAMKTTFTVADTGVGMSPAFLERIWTPFEQERLSTARLHGGTGLGLAITHELVVLMGGEIAVLSTQGRGSTFKVELTLPKVRPDEGEDGAGDEKKESDDNPLKGKTILAAEDNDLNREILIELLNEKGARVIATVNGREALAAFARSHEGEIDAVLMDMQMPVMDGCAAAGEIRKLDRPDAKTVYIVACTANAFQDDIERTRAAGMDDHLAKPLDINKLEQLLKSRWNNENI